MICSSGRSVEENNFPQNYVHILLAHTERQCFPVRADTECKIVKSSVQILTWLFPTNGTLLLFFQTFYFVSGYSQLGLPQWLSSKESSSKAGDSGSILEWGRSPGGGHGNPFQDSYLENLHGHRSLEGYGPLGHKELDTTIATEHARTHS